MPRPTAATPIDRTIETTRAIATWCKTYDGVTRAAHGHSFDGAAVCLRVSDRLEAADAQLASERRDDVQGTRQRNDVITATQRYLRSVLASALLAFEGAPDASKLLRDFTTGPPSKARTLGAARKAVGRALKATETHRDKLDAKVPRAQRHLDDGQMLLQQINHTGEFETRELIETQQAYRERDEAQAEALRTITLIQLAAEAMEFQQPEALADLFKLYEQTNSAPTTRSTADEVLGGGFDDSVVTDDDNEEPSDAQATN